MIKPHASANMQARVRELLALKKGEKINLEERSELDHYLQLEHVMRLAKARDLLPQ